MIRGPDTLDTQIKGERWSRRIQVGMNTLAEDEASWVPADRRLVSQGGGLTCDGMGLRVAMRGCRTLVVAKHLEVVERVGQRADGPASALVDPWERKRGGAAPGLSVTWDLVDCDDRAPVYLADGCGECIPWTWHRYTRTLTARGVKHDLSIDGPQFARPEYRWRCTPGPLVTLTENARGDFELRHAGNPWCDVRRPNAVDATGATVGLDVALEGLDLVCRLQLTGREKWPVVIDPTSTITGAASIDDNTLGSASPNANWGGFSTWYIAGGKNLARLSAAAIPAGTLSACRFYCRNWQQAGAQPLTIDAYPITNASGDWVEGTASGTTQTGSSCWNYRQYATLAWGTAGLAAPTDHAASPDSSTATGSLNTHHLIATLSAATVTAWRTNPNGFMWWSSAGAGGRYCAYYQVDYGVGAHQPYFEVDYTVGNRRRRLFGVRS